MRIFDTHAHYDHALFKNEGPKILHELIANGTVSGAIIPAISFESNYCREMFPEQDFPSVWFAAGLHPKVASNTKFWGRSERAEFEKLLEEPRTKAIKTGLDYSRIHQPVSQKERQKEFLKLMIAYANDYSLPLVIHVRDAVDDLVQILEEMPLQVEAETHCATFGPAIAARLIEAGVTGFGLGGMVTREEMEPLREMVSVLPEEYILLETDAPFVRPANHSGGVNTSAVLPAVAVEIGAIRKTTAENIIRIANRNAERMFKVPTE